MAGSTTTIFCALGMFCVLGLVTGACGTSSSTPSSDTGSDVVDAPSDLRDGDVADTAPLSPKDAIDCFFAAWEEPAVDKRRALLTRCWTDYGSYLDPSVQASNRDQLVTVIGEFQTKNAGAKLPRTSGVDTHHARFRDTFEIRSASGTKTLDGMDFGDFASDGRIRRVVRFFGLLPPVGGVRPTSLDAYVNAWGEINAVKRKALLKGALTSTTPYITPSVSVIGADALDTQIALEQVANPGIEMVLAGAADLHHGFARFLWRIQLSPGAEKVRDGVTLVGLDSGGLLTEITSFAEPIPPHE